MNEEILEVNANTKPAENTAPPKSAGFKLDWQESEIKLAKGRFSHTLSRPPAELVLEREKELQAEIPIAKDGSFALPDATANEEIDAKYYDLIAVKSDGYKGAIPASHKAAAFQALYQREIYLDPECDIFGEELTVLEEIGSGDEPDFVIRHILRQPSEAELKKIRQASSGGRLLPDKRGRQKIVTTSNLRSAMKYYSILFLRIEDVNVPADVTTNEQIIALVDPLIQRKVVNTVVEGLVGGLLD